MATVMYWLNTDSYKLTLSSPKIRWQKIYLVEKVAIIQMELIIYLSYWRRSQKNIYWRNILRDKNIPYHLHYY